MTKGLKRFTSSIINFDNVELPLSLREVTLSRTLNNAMSTLSVKTFTKISAEVNMQKLRFKELDNLRFKGLIYKQKSSKTSEDVIETELEAFDDLSYANKRLVAEIFPESTGPHKIRDILVFLLNKYLPEVTYNNVEMFDSEITDMIFEYEPLFKCLKKLAEVSNCFFYLDRNNDLHFFQSNEGTISVTYGDGNFNIIANSESVDRISTEIVNRLWVIGAKQAGIEPTEQVFNFDGQNRVFSLGYEPNYVKAYTYSTGWNTVKIGEQKNYDGTQYFLYNKMEKAVQLAPHITTPGSGQFKIEYRPTIEIIDFFEDMESQAKYDLYEEAVKSKDIKTKAEARKIARTSLRTNSTTITQISFTTRDTSPLVLGKLMPVKLADYSIDGLFLVVDLTYNFDIKKGDVTAQVTVRG